MLHSLDDELIVVGDVEDGAGRTGVAQLAKILVAQRHEVVARSNAEQVTEVAERCRGVNLKPGDIGEGQGHL